MTKSILIAFACISSCAFANTQPSNNDIFVSPAPSLTAQQYVWQNGEYRICKNKAGSRTFVMDDKCLWETEMSKDELMHPRSVAGLKVELAETESVQHFLSRELAGFSASLLNVKTKNEELVIYYAIDRNELVAR